MLFRYVIRGLVRTDYRINTRESFHVCNLINDEYGHIWIIDGQIERVFDLNQPDHIEELDKRYRPDYVYEFSLVSVPIRILFSTPWLFR